MEERAKVITTSLFSLFLIVFGFLNLYVNGDENAFMVIIVGALISTYPFGKIVSSIKQGN